MSRVLLIAALALVGLASPGLAQTAPVIDAAALPGQGSATAATSTVTSRPVKLETVLTLCVSGANYVPCPAPSSGAPYVVQQQAPVAPFGTTSLAGTTVTAAAIPASQ